MSLKNRAIKANADSFKRLDFSNEDMLKFKKDNNYMLMMGFPSNHNCNLKCKFCFTDTHDNKGYVMSYAERLTKELNGNSIKDYDGVDIGEGLI